MEQFKFSELKYERPDLTGLGEKVEKLTERLNHAQNYEQALAVYMEQDRLIMDVLGEHVARHYIQGKRKEWNEYQTRVSSWELEKYLVTY